MPDKNYDNDFETVTSDIGAEDIAYYNELHNSGQKSIDHYEYQPVYDHEYYGPRFKYGLTVGMYRVSTVPKGEIQNTYKPDDMSNGATYGTIEYPYALTEEQLTNFQLINFQAVNIITPLVGEEGYNTWYDTEAQAGIAITSMRDNGIKPEYVSRAYHSESNDFKYKIYRSQEEIAKLNNEFSIKQADIQITEKATTDLLLAERNNIDGFGSELAPMQLGKTVITLNKAIQVDGKPTTVKALVKKLIESGELTSAELHDVIKPMTRTQINRANQKEQDAHEKKIKDAGKKTVYYVGSYDLGKTAHDYAQHLIWNYKRGNIETPKTKAPEVNDINTNNYHAVYDKESGKVLDVFSNSQTAQQFSNTHKGQSAVTFISAETYDDFHNGTTIIRNASGVMESQQPTDLMSRPIGRTVAFKGTELGIVKEVKTGPVSWSSTDKITLALDNGHVIRYPFEADSGYEIMPVITIDPAAQKYLDDRQQHNDQAKEHNRLRTVGQEALPGIRFQDAADVGRVYESFKKGDLTDQQWNDYTADLISSNKVTPQPTRADYEAKPPFDDEYSGPRFKYGMINRPFGIATAPKGAILMTYKADDKESGSRHGTIEYPFQLTKDEVYNFELVDFPAIKQQAIDVRIIRNEFSEALEKRGFILTVSTDERMLADLAVPNGFIQAGLNENATFSAGERGYSLYLNTDKLTNPIILEYKTPADIDIPRSLAWIDKEITKTNTLFESDNVRIDLASPFSRPTLPELTDHEKHINAVYHATVLHYEGEIHRRGFTTQFGENEQSMIATKDLVSNIYDNDSPDERTVSTRIYKDDEGYHLELSKDSKDHSISLVYDTPAQININNALNFIDSELANHTLDYDMTRDMIVEPQPYAPEFTYHILPGMNDRLVRMKESGRSIGHVQAGKLLEFTEGDFSVFKPFQNWKNTYSKNLQNYLKLNNSTIAIGESQTPTGKIFHDTYTEPTRHPDTDKIASLALTLAKHNNEILSYGELNKLTGLTNAELDTHWETAKTIADKALEDATLRAKGVYRDLSYQVDRHTSLHLNGPPMVIHSPSESKLQDEPMFYSPTQGMSSLSDQTRTFTKTELEAIDLAVYRPDAIAMPYSEAQQLVAQDKEDNKHDGAYIKGQIILNHAHELKNACELRLNNDTNRYDFAAEINKLDQATAIITGINDNDLKNHVFKLDYQAAMSGNPLAHDHEDRRQSIITQIDTFKKDLATTEDPEANLRELWTKQGVSQERQDAILADITTKAQPGAMVGPFVISQKGDNTITEPQNYKFQITGFQESNPDTYMLGLGVIDDKNRFTGTLKDEDYIGDLSKLAEYNAKSDPYCAWDYAGGYGICGNDYYTVSVYSLPITNITVIQQQEQNILPSQTPTGGNTMDNMTPDASDTVSVTTEYKITGAKLAEKFEKLELSQTKKASYLDNRIAYLATMPESSEKTIKGQTKTVTKTQELGGYARTEAINSMSKGEYVHNMNTMREINKTRNGAPLSSEDQERYSKAKDNNARLSKKADHPDQKQEFANQFKKAMYFNCTPEGLEESKRVNAVKLQNTSTMLVEVKKIPEHEFSIKIKEQRNLPNLSYDEKFTKELSAAVAAKIAPPAAEKKAGTRKR